MFEKKNCYDSFACNILHLRCTSQFFFDFLLSSRLRLIGATTMWYALKMHQHVFRYCANEYKMDVNGKFGLVFFLFSGVYAYN